MLTISLYHLIAVKKDRRWLQVVALGVAVVFIMSPLLYRMVTDGATRIAEPGYADETAEIISTWLLVFSNGNVWLALAAAVGAVLGWRRGVWRNNPFLLLILLLGVSIAMLSEASGAAKVGRMRYFLVGVPILAGFISSGFYVFYRQRRWLGLLAALLWMIAGLHFMANGDWEKIADARFRAYAYPPWHLIGRQLRQTDENLLGMEFGLDQKVLDRKWGRLRRYYFGQYGMQMQNRSTRDIDERVGGSVLETPGYWILFQRGVTDPSDMAIVRETLDKYNYEACGIQAFPNKVDLYTYRWKSLHCDTQPKATYKADAGDYLHYGARHDESRLLFIGAWQPATDADPGTHNISFQLLDANWRSHAQIDLPTWSLSDMRQPIFELTDLPAGDYRLMAIVYDARTGERQVWRDNEDWIPEMQQLAEIAIPERADESL